MDESEYEEMMRDEMIAREYWKSIQTEVPVAKKRKLPSVVEKYVNSAAEVSYENEIPAALTFFVLLGQLCKDLVAIPFGRRTDDTRIQVIWMQTSGTGKSELYNFFGPISEYVFKHLNKKHGTNLDIFNVKDTTDAALVGSMDVEKQSVTDDEGNTTVMKVPVQIYGGLEGNGLCAYDEFEYSGVFKPSQHKENVVMYLNTMMNSLHGQNWIITKRLKEGGNMECRCQRSLLAMTYIPISMSKVIAETGLMQRSLLFIREVPIEKQNYLREKVAMSYGKKIDSVTPVREFGDAFIKIYETLKRHHMQVLADGGHIDDVVQFDDSFSDAIITETRKFQDYVQSSRPSVLSLANNFITRMQGSMARMAVLCCIAEAPNMKLDDRYIVTSRHVQQASHLVRECYFSLVSWLDMSLKREAKTFQDTKNIKAFRKVYRKMQGAVGDNMGRVNKTQFLEEVRKETQLGQATVYRHYSELLKTKKFSELKKGRSVYTRLTEDEA
jgi:hypothetical protein